MGLKELTGKIIGAAIDVHKALGPGLLESAYEECLCYEFGLRKIGFERQKHLSVISRIMGRVQRENSQPRFLPTRDSSKAFPNPEAV